MCGFKRKVLQDLDALATHSLYVQLSFRKDSRLTECSSSSHKGCDNQTIVPVTLFFLQLSFNSVSE